MIQNELVHAFPIFVKYPELFHVVSSNACYTSFLFLTVIQYAHLRRRSKAFQVQMPKVNRPPPPSWVKQVIINIAALLNKVLWRNG